MRCPPGRRASRIRRELEASLGRLGVERIDLYQMHWPTTDGTPIETYWQTLLDLKKEGKVRAVGLPTIRPRSSCRRQLGHVETLQPPFSAIRRDFAETERLPWSHAAMRPASSSTAPCRRACSAGAFTAEQRAHPMPKDDWRRRDPIFPATRWRPNLALADAMKPIAEKHGTTVASVAIAWTLAWPGVTGAIVGARSPQQVDGWLDAGRIELTAEDMRTIAKAIEKTGAGAGPALPSNLK